MAFNFPSSPSPGEEYVSGGVTFVWNGFGWTVKSALVRRSGDTMSGDLHVMAKIGIGTTDPTYQLQVSRISGGDQGFVVDSYDGHTWASLNDYTDDGYSEGLYFSMAHGTPLAPIALRQNDFVGSCAYGGYDGANWMYSTNFYSVVDGPVSAGHIPMALIFQSGTSNYGLERLRLASDGQVLLKADPTSAFGVATKRYVDNLIAAIPAPDLSTKVSKTGDTMSGALSISAAMNSATVKITGDGDRLRWRGDTFSVISHHNSGSFYLMLTDAGNPDAGWNGLRPFRIDSNGNVVMAHAVNAGSLTTSTFTTNSSVQFNQPAASLYQGSGGGILIYANGSAGYDAFISYWRPGGGYAANMGMMNDNRFGFGGWSVGGGVQYRFWSREDFNEPPVHNTRLVYVGDYVHSSDYGLEEPYGATSVHTGCSGANPSGYGGSYLTMRYRALQVRRSDGYYGTEAA